MWHRHQISGGCTFLGCCSCPAVPGPCFTQGGKRSNSMGGNSALPWEGIQQFHGRELSIASAYHGPLASFDPHLVVAALLSIQGAHEGADGSAPNHVHGNASLNQCPDNAHLGAAPVPREGRKGKKKKSYCQPNSH